MKKGSSIVNTSRGEIIDEKEVITMLKSGDLFGYATDVLSEELEVANNMITGLDCPLNILYTPHIGGCTKEAMQTTEVLLAKYYSQY